MKRKSIFLCFCILFLLAGCSAGSAAAESAGAESNASETAEPAEAASSADSGDDTPVVVESFAMDTYITLQAYGENAETALTEVSAMLTELDSLLSVTDEGSEIYAVNQSAGTAVPVSDVTFSLLQRSLDFGKTVDGALDITIYPVSRAWGFTTGDYQIPDNDTIRELLAFVDDDAISLNEEACTVTVPEQTEVDLGAVVKGYAGDAAADLLSEYGVSSALLNFGGSTIRTVGTKPDGSLWRIAIQDPNDPESYAGILEVAGTAIDTSGGYERYFVGEDGETYWHILDPSTGKPARSGLISVTILSDESFYGDCLSTAFFVMGLDGAIDYWEVCGGFEFILIDDNCDIYVSEGAADLFTPVGTYADSDLYVVYHEESVEE